MRKVNINRRTRTVWHRNPISCHEWSTQVLMKGFEVSGGDCGTLTTNHSTIRNAEKEKEYRERMCQEFPFVMPRSQREIDKCKKLGLTIPEPYVIMSLNNLECKSC